MNEKNEMIEWIFCNPTTKSSLVQTPQTQQDVSTGATIGSINTLSCAAKRARVNGSIEIHRLTALSRSAAYV